MKLLRSWNGNVVDVFLRLFGDTVQSTHILKERTGGDETGSELCKNTRKFWRWAYV